MSVEEPEYGWLKYRPRFLQCCLTSRWILVVCSMLVAVEGFIVSGLVSITITSLERRYYLKSFQVGGIITCYEVSAVALTLIVSYYGHVHKAKWLGSGAIALGIGCLIFAMPQWLSGDYIPIVARTSDLCLTETSYNATTPTEQQICKTSDWYYILIFVLGQLLIGAGASPIYTLCTAFIDENVSRKNSGICLAVFYTISGLGPALGYVLGGYFLTIYVDIDQPQNVNLTPNDNAWVGAWWLGYVFAGIVSLISSVPILGFPNHLPNSEALKATKTLAKDFVPDEERPRTLKEFLPALKSILKNKVFLFTTIAVTAEAFNFTGVAFFPKFIESQYNLSSSDTSLYTGVIVPGAALGILFGGYLIRRFQWSCKECIKVTMVLSMLSGLMMFVYLIRCPNKDIAGVTPSQSNSSIESSLNSCHTRNNCSCKVNYIPVCTRETQITYFSPCHAGCSQQTIIGEEQVYTNCSCLPGDLTTVYEGGCNKACDSLPYFLALICFMVFLSFAKSIPAITVILRCVPESQGSFALGAQQFIFKLFAFIPGPIIFGAMLDSVCILSETDACEENSDRNCLEYRNDHLSYVFLGAMGTCKTIAVIFYTLAWFSYEPPAKQQHNNNENDEEIPLQETSITT